MMNLLHRDRSRRGFTLIELLIVVAIVGLLAGIAVGQYKRRIRMTKEALLRENLYVMRSQISNYLASEGEYPFDLRALVDEGYLRKIPIDPITGSSETWNTMNALATDQDLSMNPGIEDVFSGADGAGMNGVPYDEW